LNGPKTLVFAGPNGSGKSTAANALDIIGLHINADDIQARTGCSDLAAAKEAERLREHCLAGRMDFTFETVLSTDRNMALLRRAKAEGYHVESVFVLTAAPEINVLRVKSRVSEGGHDVPEDKIRSRYTKSLANLPELRELSDVCTVFDNTSDRPEAVYRKDAEREALTENEHWPEPKLRKLLGL
jgi:predicted ABC-type ATPase